MKGGRIFRRGRKWWVAFYWRGQEHRESAGSTREEARRRLKRRRRELAADNFLPGEDSATVADLVSAYAADLERRGSKSLASFRSHLKPVNRLLGNDLAIEVSARRIEWFQRRRIASKKSRATINRETEILRAAFRLAQKNRVLRHLPHFPMYHLENQRRGFFESDEVEAVSRHLPEALRDVVLFAYLSGWRKGEILNLTWDAVDRVAQEVRLFTSKNGRPRTLPLEGKLWSLIEHRWIERRVRNGSVTQLCPFVFHDGGRPLGDFRKAWSTACKDADLSGKLFHDLRRTAVRNMIRARVSKTVAMSITGHRTDAVFDRYDIDSDEDKRKALRDAQTYVDADRAAREALSSQEREVASPVNPAAGKRTKKRTKKERG